MWHLFQTYQNTIIFVLGVVGTIMFAYLSTRFATRKDHDALAERVTKIESKTGVLEAQIASSPSIDDFSKLNLSITRLEGEIAKVNTKFEGAENLVDRLQKQTDRLEDFLRIGIAR